MLFDYDNSDISPIQNLIKTESNSKRMKSKRLREDLDRFLNSNAQIEVLQKEVLNDEHVFNS